MFAARKQNKFQRIMLALLAAFVLFQGSVQSATAFSENTVTSALAAEDIYDQTLSATVLIVAYDHQSQALGTGTGWIADKDRGLLITNHHVVADAAQVHVYFPQFKDGELLADLEEYQFVKPEIATVMDTDMRLDLATIKVNKIPATARSLELASKSARPGSAVHTIGGMPEGSSGLFSYATGAVRQVQNSGLNTYGNRIRTIETNLSSNRGNSGGPMVNDQGQVVGVVSNGSPIEDIANQVISGVDVQLLRVYLDTVKDLLLLDTAEKCDTMGRRHSQEGRYQVAIDYFTRAIARDSTNAEYFEDRAAAFYFLNDLETAMANVNQAIQLNSKSATGFTVRATVHEAQENLPAALADWTQSISIEPTGFRYGQRGQLLSRMNQPTKAVSDLNRAIALEPREAEHLMERTVAYAKLGQLAQAQEDLKAAISLEQTDHAAFNSLGIVLFHGDKFDLAFAAFAAASRIDQSVALYASNAGIALRSAGNYKLAIDWFDWALKIDPQNDGAREGKQLAMDAMSQANTQTAVNGSANTQAETSHSVVNQSTNPLVGTWSLNVTEGSQYIHAYITLGNGGQYGGVIQMLNQDRTVKEQLIDGTWQVRGNQLTINTKDGSVTSYTVQLSGKTLNVFQEGKHVFSYRRIS